MSASSSGSGARGADVERGETDAADVIASALRAFRAAYGRGAGYVARAPGRINLIGEHVDYCGGQVLPMAIQRDAAVLAAPSRDDLTRIRSTAFDEEVVVDRSTLRLPRPTGTFADRLLGVLEAFHIGPWATEHGPAVVPPVELLVHSSVPLGGGLSSSAAVEAATAVVGMAVAGSRPAPEHSQTPGADDIASGLLDDDTARCLARVCQWAEHEAAGVPCGIMDMLVALAGRRGHAIHLDCRSVRWEVVPVPVDAAFLVVDTGTRHDHASGAYATLRQECEAAAQALGVSALADADARMVERARLPSALRERARHVTSETERVRRFVDAMRHRDLARMGHLLLECHESLRRSMGVSTPALDAVVEDAVALRSEGVHGARLTGGGFGGCAIVLCDASRTDSVRRTLLQRLTSRLAIAPEVFEARPSSGATIVHG